MSDNNSPVILLTGGSRGLGLAIANYLLTNSAAKLFVVARGAASLEALKDSYPAGRIEILAGDLGELGVGVAAVRKTIEVFGKIDAVVVNHGVLDPTARIEDADVEAWKTCFNINYFSAVEIVKEAIPALRASHGRVVFVSSGAATTPYLAWGAYGGTKAAMNHFASTLGAEEKDFTSISIRPGVVDTAMQESIRATCEEAMGAGFEKFRNLKKDNMLLRPEQPGHVIAKLALETLKDLSGKFLSWNSPELASYQEN